MKHTFRPFMTIVMLLAALVPQSAWAWGGSGSTNSPYTISTAADMQRFANIVNGTGGETRNVSACARLMGNITLSGEWTPIGNSSGHFKGTFDGQGYTIDGMAITNYTAVNRGLFGYVEGATIKNFTLNGTMSSNTQITGSENDCSGAVVGRATGSSTIKDIVCKVDWTLTKAQKHLGGIVGQIDGSTTVSGCTYLGTLDAGPSTDCVGGIVGFASASCSGSITNCFFNGSLKSSASSPTLGGILGYTNDESKNFGGVQHCYSDGKYDFNGNQDDTGKYVNAIVGRIRNYAETTNDNTFLYSTASRACNTDGPSIPSSNQAIRFKFLEGHQSTAAYTYIYPTSTTSTQLRAEVVPEKGYHFDRWSDKNTDAVRIFSLERDIDTYPMCSLNEYTVKIRANTDGYGVAYLIDDLHYVTECTVRHGNYVDIQASPSVDYHFTGWANFRFSSPSMSVKVTSDTTFIANFAPHTYGDWVLDSPSTCSVQGQRHRTCTYESCGVVETKLLPVEEHDYVVVKDAKGNAVWDWDDGCYAARLSLVCTRDAGHTTDLWADQRSGTITNVITTPAACGKDGVRTYTATLTHKGVTYTSTKTESIPALTHDYQVVKDAQGNAMWEWDGYSKATLLVRCTHDATHACDIVKTEDAITNAITTPVKCEQDGVRTYTTRVYYNGVTYTGTKTESIPALAHDYHVATDKYGTAVWSWEADYTIAKLKLVCSHDDSHISDVVATGDAITVTTTPPTCNGWGVNVYRATLTYEGETYSREARKNLDPLALGQEHQWDAHGQCTVCGLGGKAVYKDGTLTFYWDNLSHEGDTYVLNIGDDDPDWRPHRAYIVHVVFDANFANARPVSCKSWFSECVNLEDITGIEYLKTEEVTDMQYMFYRCEKLASIDLHTFNTPKLENMYYMFARCESFTSLNLNHFTTNKVKNMGYMFDGCKKLQSLNLVTFNTANVQDFTRMFRFCYNLENLQCNISLASVKTGGKLSMFYECGKNVVGGGCIYSSASYDAMDELATDTDFEYMHYSFDRPLRADNLQPLADLVLFDKWTNRELSRYDLNHDGKLTIADLTIFIRDVINR